MGEGTDRPVGERRRRREAERAAARAAESSGATRPLTRRELRWQEAEEAARLDAIATGELPLGHLWETEGAPAESAGPASSTLPGSASSASSAAPAPPSGGSAPSATSASAAAATPSASSTEAAPTGAPAAAPAASSGAPTTVPSSASAVSAGEARDRLPTRRSLRERAQDAASAPVEGPQERTATGRRPVVRTPSTARGVRSLDATGELSGILPVVRPDAPDQVQAVAEPDDAVTVAEHDTFSVDLDGPSRAARAALPAADPAAPVDDDGEDEDFFPLRPQWVAISGITGATPEEAKVELPSRRSLRSRLTDPDPDPDVEPAATESEPQRENPAVRLVKVVVLVLVAAVIGALIWMVGNEAFEDDAPAESFPALALTITHTPEETSAR